MGKLLSDEQIRQFKTEGYVCGVPVLTDDDVDQLTRHLTAFEAREGTEVWARIKNKPHLVVLWLNSLMRRPRILDAVEDVFGPNILAWGTSIFAKPARSPGYYNWHQDTAYWGLSEPGVVTAWVALTPSTPTSGCMRVIPGSHRSALPHRDTFQSDSLLSRGQEVEVEVDEGQAVDLVLRPGECSLHDGRIIHGSNPNRADHDRVGVGLRYTSTVVRPITEHPDSATLVRGRDEFRHFLPEPEPAGDFDPVCVAFYEQMADIIRHRKAQLAEPAR